MSDYNRVLDELARSRAAAIARERKSRNEHAKEQAEFDRMRFDNQAFLESRAAVPRSNERQPLENLVDILLHRAA